jgi:hypothetical protein
MENTTRMACGLEPAQVEQFITDGFVRVDHAFPRRFADEARSILWKATDCDPDDPATWTQPIIRLGMFSQPPFIEAANTTLLHAAFDQLIGEGRWRRPAAIGTFPVRFPSPNDPGDAGWHIDVSFGTDALDFLDWRANIHSKGRALLMLFLFSDVSERDAPTRIRVGSHADIARQPAPAGDEELTLRGNWRPTDSRRAPIGRLSPQQARPARYTCVTHSWCMRHSRIMATFRASWRNHRCFPWTRTIGRARSTPWNWQQHGLSIGHCERPDPLQDAFAALRHATALRIAGSEVRSRTGTSVCAYARGQPSMPLRLRRPARDVIQASSV